MVQEHQLHKLPRIGKYACIINIATRSLLFVCGDLEIIMKFTLQESSPL